MTRGLSSDALLHQLAGFLAYEAHGGAMDFLDWADAKAFTAEERMLLELAYMSASDARWPEA